MRTRVALVAVAALALTTSSFALAAPTTWTVPGDFPTIQATIDSPLVVAGDTIQVAPGNHSGALVTKSVSIVGDDGTIIDSGPIHGSGLIQGFRLLTGGDDAVIQHLTFTVDLAIMNGDGVDRVTVSHNTFLSSIQAISNWRGNYWNIGHNIIENLRTRCGGGIGVLVGDYSGGTVVGNDVHHNRIYGNLNVSAGDCGGYNGSGIVLYADFRWGGAGAAAITGNTVYQNKIGLVSDTPLVVDVVAFELTDTRDGDPDVIYDNTIAFNDFRDTTLQIALTPSDLDLVNTISRNLGENRGQGVHPGAVFGPGGS